MDFQPTLVDVAREARVSTALASLVFRESPKVSPARRAAVLTAAEKLGYQPNESARRLKSRVTNTVGVILTNIHNPYYGEIYYGIENSSRALGYKLLIGNSGDSEVLHPTTWHDEDEARQIEAIKTIRGQKVDGLIIAGSQIKTEELQRITGNIPIVQIGHTKYKNGHLYNTVNSDEKFAVTEIVKHLANLKHRRIAHISGGEDPGPRFRSHSYLAAMKGVGLEKYATVIPGAWSEEAGYEAAKTALKLKPMPTAIFAASDLIAIGALAALNEAGLSVPEDISLFGYDDSALAKLRVHPLSSVKDPLTEMGRKGFEILAAILKTEDSSIKPKKYLIKPKLVLRASTAICKK